MGLEPKISRLFRKPLVRLSKPHSFWTNDHFLVNQNSVKNLSFYRFRSKGLKYEEFSWNFFAMLSKSQFSIGRIQYYPWTLFIFWTFPTSEREMFGISPQNFWNCFFKAAIFVYRRTFSAKVSIWKENYAFCHFSTLLKKVGPFRENFRLGCPNCLPRM